MEEGIAPPDDVDDARAVSEPNPVRPVLKIERRDVVGRRPNVLLTDQEDPAGLEIVEIAADPLDGPIVLARTVSGLEHPSREEDARVAAVHDLDELEARVGTLGIVEDLVDGHLAAGLSGESEGNEESRWSTA